MPTTTRLTDVRIELDDTELEDLNRKITKAMERKKEVRVICFLPDKRKAGGAYADMTGRIKRIEMGEIIMENRQRIPIGDVLGVESI